MAPVSREARRQISSGRRKLRELSHALRGGPDRWLVIPVGPNPASTLLDSVAAVTRRAALIGETVARGVGEGDVWDDFLGRPADYFALLAELGFITDDVKKARGSLPEDVVEAIRAQELRTDNIRASLRGYQSFVARFALVQDKVSIGDEMGLGKTVEALATLAHLRSTGETHFLVVCPAAVVSNWMRETTRHTTLRAYRIHGDPTSRLIALRNWTRAGGVGVTTFDLLERVMSHLPRVELACIVVDEAHYIKNPRAQRSQRAQAVITAVPRAILMSGTPLENRVEEFRNLIGYIHPDLANTASEISASRFRKHVAPVYLRRNQEDVLTELPELVEVDEWLGMSTEDHSNYLDAVIDGNFTAMRRAAMLDPRSEKLNRLHEIVTEAEANGRRVIVYSYFLDVLRLIADELPGQVFGPITGRVPAARRQEIVDAFSAADGGAVLVSQIVAGGVGFNIQSASVVVICEPQLKPTTESQAIARAHRMGQVQSVQVHRLLSEDSVDERILEILARKKQVFDDFARESDMADSAPEAVDISEVEIAREVVLAERLKLLCAEQDAPLAAGEP
jgi:superfamily II DNA or RNA helicase